MPRNNQSDGKHGNGRHASHPVEESASTVAARPHWQGSTATLFFMGCVVKRFDYPSRDAELLLAAFEEQSWPPFIDDPLPPERGRNSKTHLRNLIRNFNRRLDRPLLRLRGNAFGTGVGWIAVDVTQSDTKRHQRAR
jgi:hypothetical protein